MKENEISEKIIGCALAVLRQLGPGLLESVYEEALCYEFAQAKLSNNCSPTSDSATCDWDC